MSNRRQNFASPAEQPMRVTRRVDTENYITFALSHDDSEAAANLGLKGHGMDKAQKSEVAHIVGEAVGEQPGFLSRIWDNIAVFFQCLMGQFTGECGFNDFSRLIAERRAVPHAEKIYSALKDNGYESVARSISGMEPVDPADPKKGLKPMRDASGHYTGMVGREIGIAANPQMSMHTDAVDAGLQPSAAQIAMNEREYDEAVKLLYTDPAFRQGIAAERAQRASHPAKDIEAEKVVKANHDLIERMADKMIAIDEEARHMGHPLGRFEYKNHRKAIIQRLEGRIRTEHKQLFDRYEGVAPPASLTKPDGLSPSIGGGSDVDPAAPVRPNALPSAKASPEPKGKDGGR